MAAAGGGVQEDLHDHVVRPDQELEVLHREAAVALRLAGDGMLALPVRQPGVPGTMKKGTTLAQFGQMYLPV